MKQENTQEFVCEYSLVLYLTYSICQQPETRSDVLVRCYSCGITVHRFCYGICDAKSPWLCYACTANQKYPVCALCKKVLLEIVLVITRELLIPAFLMELGSGFMFSVQSYCRMFAL